MNAPYTSPDASPISTHSANLRRDVRRRDIVNHGLALQQQGNTLGALEYLKWNGITAAVIERVLLEPNRRRPLPN